MRYLLIAIGSESDRGRETALTGEEIADILLIAERKGLIRAIHGAHPRSREGADASKTAVLPFCRTLCFGFEPASMSAK